MKTVTISLCLLFVATSLANTSSPVVDQSPVANQSKANSTCASGEINSALAMKLGQALLQGARLPGLSVAALQGDQLVLAQGFGFSDVEARAPVQASTRFLAASVSKVITATAALSLAGKNRFDLDARAPRYLPELEAPDDVIDARMLAAHLSGIPHYGPFSMRPDGHYEKARHSLDVFLHAPRVGAPGQRYHYSTHGFTLLAAMMEAATELAFLDILQAEVFEPLSMHDSGPFRADQVQPRMTALYNKGSDGNPVRIAQPIDASYSWAGAGLASSASDLVRMTRAYWNGYLQTEQIESALSEVMTTEGQSTGVGFGWRLGEDYRGQRLAHHEGAMDGGRSALLMIPDACQSVAVLSNTSWTSSIDVTARMFAEAIFHSAPIEDAIEISGRYVGTFGADSAPGNWQIGSSGGLISVPRPLRKRLVAQNADVEHFSAFPIRPGLFALVTPWGLYPLELAMIDGRPAAEVRVGSTLWRIQGEG